MIEAYRLVTASDVSGRDGLGLELWDDSEMIAEVFRTDATGVLSASAYRTDLPLVLVEEFLDAARHRLAVESEDLGSRASNTTR
ncbi:hypothetical protein [Rubrivirga sp. IMCC45206]|uniref:hypothetical protein n=1 Tax=Rubrivirga sp. IMCC45206 TaxID=3391614 RepID=UPI0039902F9E